MELLLFIINLWLDSTGKKVTHVQTEHKNENPFASLMFISEIDFFSPSGLHAENCAPDERPMLARFKFKEVLHQAVSQPETVMNKCGDAVILMLLTTGLPLEAIPTEYTVNEETLTLVFYQHKEPEDRPLHYNVLTGHFHVLFKEVHSYWRITEDTNAPDYYEAYSSLHLRRGL